MARKIGTDLPI